MWQAADATSTWGTLALERHKRCTRCSLLSHLASGGRSSKGRSQGRLHHHTSSLSCCFPPVVGLRPRFPATPGSAPRSVTSSVSVATPAAVHGDAAGGPSHCAHPAQQSQVFFQGLQGGYTLFGPLEPSVLALRCAQGSFKGRWYPPSGCRVAGSGGACLQVRPTFSPSYGTAVPEHCTVHNLSQICIDYTLYLTKVTTLCGDDLGAIMKTRTLGM